MKFFILALCVACAAAASPEQVAAVVRSNYDQTPEGGYNYAFETENGIFGSATGTLAQVSKDEAAVVVQGESSYKNPDGDVISITYTADANGYHPQGAHLPTPPPPQPIPDYILRSLEYIAAHPYVEKKY